VVERSTSAELLSGGPARVLLAGSGP
jgi:hypothetical protein